MNNHKKSLSLDWNFIISFIIASFLQNAVEEFMGFKRIPFTKGFNGGNFAEDMLIFMICYMSIYFLLVKIKTRRTNK